MLARVRSDIASLEGLLGEDREASEALETLRRLRARTRRARQRGCMLHAQLKSLATDVSARRKAAASERVAASGSDVARLQGEVKTAAAWSHDARELARARSAAAAAAVQAASEADGLAMDAEAAMVHATVQAEETARQQKALREEGTRLAEATEAARAEQGGDEGGASSGEAARQQISGRLQALREEALAAEESLMQLRGGGGIGATDADGEVCRDADVGSGRPTLVALKNEAERAERATQQAHTACRSAEAEGRVRLEESSARLRRGEAQLQV